MTEMDDLGPVDYLVVEFPGNKMTGEGFPILVDLAERQVIRILDLVFIRKDADGSVTAMELKDLDDTGGELSLFAGAESGLLGREDLDEASNAVEPGCSGAVLLYENRWAVPFVQAIRRGGAQLVASGRIPHEDVAEAVEALSAHA